MLIATEIEQQPGMDFKLSGPILYEYIDATGARLLEVYIPDLFGTVIMEMNDCVIEETKLN